MRHRYLLVIIFTLFQQNSRASSCCGGGSSSSSLIIADNLRELILSSSYRDNIGETNLNGEATLLSNTVKDKTYHQSFEVKSMISERWQWGGKLSYLSKVLKKSGRHESNKGLGDFSLGLNYEAITNYSYDEIWPRTFIGIRFNYPFGKNLYRSKQNLNADVRGNGYQSIGLTSVVLKQDYQFSFLPTFTPAQREASSFFSYTLGLIRTFSFNHYSVGGGAMWNYTEPSTKKTAKIQNWDVKFFCAYKINQQYTLGLNYTDNTLVGKSINAPLSREIGINLSWTEAL